MKRSYFDPGRNNLGKTRAESFSAYRVVIRPERSESAAGQADERMRSVSAELRSGAESFRITSPEYEKFLSASLLYFKMKKRAKIWVERNSATIKN